MYCWISSKKSVDRRQDWQYFRRASPKTRIPPLLPTGTNHRYLRHVPAGPAAGCGNIGAKPRHHPATLLARVPAPVDAASDVGHVVPRGLQRAQDLLGEGGSDERTNVSSVRPRRNTPG